MPRHHHWLRLLLVASFTAATTAVAAEPVSMAIASAEQPAGTLSTSVRHEVDAAIRRARQWLAANQKPDGSWSNADYPALTALPLWALTRNPTPDESTNINAAVQFMLSCVNTNGGIYREVPGKKGGGLSNYNTAICMTALHATRRPDLDRVVQRARTFVAGAQYHGDDAYAGGFGYDSVNQRAYTDLLNTYYSAQSMRLTADVEETRPAGEPRADINWGETVRYIERMQNTAAAGPEDAGGFIYNPTDPRAGTTTNAQGVVVFRSYGSITYVGMLALVFADVSREDVRVRSALKWAQQHWTLDENPGFAQEGVYFYYHVLTRALAATGQDIVTLRDGTALNWREAVATKLLALQRIDPATGNGYWINEVGRYWENDPALVTAYALLALEALKTE